MRIRTAQRNLAEIRLSLIERKRTMLQLPEECIKTLNHALKSVCTIFETFLKLFLSAITRELLFNLQLQVADIVCKESCFHLDAYSLNVSSPRCRLVVRSLPARWRTNRHTRLKVQLTEVTQPLTSVAIPPWITKYTARLKH